MFTRIISFSLENKLIILIGVVIMAIVGFFSARQIPLDAVPDITNNQVQIVTSAPTYAPQEVEQLITYPLEAGMTNIPNVTEVRSISRYGLSVITVVFEEFVDLMLARQYVQEQLQMARSEIPSNVEPELMPITTGLGEIYQYVLTVDPSVAHEYDATRLRTIQDWIVKRQLNGTKGIIETSSFGGYLKQYEVSINPSSLKNYNLTLQDVINALEENNQNSGGSYLEKESYSYYIRTQGRANTITDIEQIQVANNAGAPILIRDIATIGIGSAKRYGAMTMDGKGEVVGGITLMLKGGNSSEALENVKERIEIIKSSLPEGVSIYPYLDRSKLIGKTIDTATNNLLEGGIIVIIVLLILLGNIRAGLIVASVIPLSMLFALSLMNYFGVSANLMSLGSIDFGIVVDGAVIIVEALLYTLSLGYIGKKMTQTQMDQTILSSTSSIYRSAAFGVLIILVVFIPILTLEGTEGKTFRPMAQTLGFAILGSLILSLTYVPVMSSLFLNKEIKRESAISHHISSFLKKIYTPVLDKALNFAIAPIAIGALLLAGSLYVFTSLGAEFIPTLEEGDIAMQQAIKPGSSLQESVKTSTQAEKILLDNFPEVDHVVSKIGTAEIPTDPMAIEDADIMIILKDKEEWTTADNREDLITLMKEKLRPITWASFEFTQPIQLRFNELMTGAKSDISVKLFGENIEVLKTKADEIAALVSNLDGAGDVKVDQTDGLQQLSIHFDRSRMAQYGVNIKDANQIIRAAYAGEVAGRIYEEERNFDLVVRLQSSDRANLDLDQLTIRTEQGTNIPLSSFASIEPQEGPMLISREQARRFINIGINVRNRDVASLVTDIQNTLKDELQLPPGYEVQYGGQFENLVNARNRLMWAIPAALGLILLLLYQAFGSIKEVLIIFMAVPLSAIGGILALYLRGMPFSISSGIGFIALFGISVLDGIVLISAIKQGDKNLSLKELISNASQSRLRPVITTTIVAALGFLPMAISTGNGAEVQQPLATVVIGGLLSSTLLTLFVVPALYLITHRKKYALSQATMMMLLLCAASSIDAQSYNSFEEVYQYALDHHPKLKGIQITTQQVALEENAIGQWAPIEIGYQGGQINYAGFDHFFSINQNLRHLFGKQEKRDVIQSQVADISFQKEIVANELIFSLQNSFNNLSHLQEQKRILDSVIVLISNSLPVAEERVRAGEMLAIDMNLLRSDLTRYQQEILLLEEQIEGVIGLISQSAYLPPGSDIRAPSLNRMTSLNQALDSTTSIYAQAFLLKKEVITKEIANTDRQSKVIDLNVGYFMQTLEHEFGFDGLSIGVGIPIDRRNAKNQIQTFNLENEKYDIERTAMLKKLKIQIASLQKQKRHLKNYLDTYETTTRNLQNQINESVQAQYELGELGYLPLSQIRQDILLEKQIYILQIKKYNEIVLTLSYLTQSI